MTNKEHEIYIQLKTEIEDEYLVEVIKLDIDFKNHTFNATLRSHRHVVGHYAVDEYPISIVVDILDHVLQ